MPYHHGNLREALVDAATELAAKDGPDAVALREVSRAVGVSHNAAYRHFVDRDELLRLVAARAATEFGRVVARHVAAAGDADSADGAWSRLLATGRGYIDFAISQPGLFRTICAFALGEIEPDADVVHPYTQLSLGLDDLVTTGAIDPAHRPHAEIAAWSAVHGYAMLLLDGPLREQPVEVREAGLDQLFRIFAEGL